MPKEFYTERDIEELFARGTKSLRITENVVLTELAYEKANRLGLQLISGSADSPPAAPVQPYLSEAQTPKPVVNPAPSAVQSQPKPSLASGSSQAESGEEIEQRIRSAVIARLGNQVDAKLLDNIIHRVVKGVGLK
jgi:hypothetical protein